jgi:acyl dehydratase
MRTGDTAKRSRTITLRDIELFTEITGDRNPLHYDEDLAKRTRFGALIVQGGVTSGLLNAVVAEDLPGPGTVFLETHWRFLAPVKPGDTITAEVEVLEARADKPITKLRTTITNQDGTVVLDGNAVVFRDPVVAEATSGA